MLLQTRPTLQRLIAPVRKNGTYLYDLSELRCTLPEKNISIPLNIDTEFKSLPIHWSEAKPSGRLGITTQIRGIVADKGLILASPAFEPLASRYPVATSGFHPIDYLNLTGFQASIKRTDLKSLKGLPTAEFALYAHFALAELMLIVDGDYRQDFISLASIKNPNKPRFEMTRRIRSVTPGMFGDSDSVALPWQLTLDGQDYGVKVSWHDTGALHGMASYKDVCETAGIKLESKDNFTSAEKADMDRMALERPQDFEDYALGDLFPYDALVANAEKFRQIYEALGVASYFKPPKLTIGSTIKDLFMAVLLNQVGIDPSDKDNIKAFTESYLEPTSAGRLRENSSSTSALAAKVEGGRCRNNRPLDINVKAPLVDLDISGCYGEGQRNQEYFIGLPEVIKYETTSDRNTYWQLGEFLKAYGDDLVPGAWFAKVSTSERLVYPQDFFSSWFLPNGSGEDIMAKYVKKMGSDTEAEGTDDFNEEDGFLKVFYHEIHNGTLTHDGLEWILNIATPKQRDELLCKLRIKTAVVYPKSWRVDSYEALQEAQAGHKGRNTIKRVGKGRKTLRSDDGECHAWLGVNIGELLIDDLISNRKLYPKKTPLNTLYKLCINTLYGDMTSKFFMSANVVVGNNITARARALAWYMEKGLNGFQSITDGCAFELNKVTYPSKKTRVTGENVCKVYRKKSSERELSYKPLGGYDSIAVDWLDDGSKKVAQLTLTLGQDTTVLKGLDAMDWVDKTSMVHLQNLFPKVSVLHAESTELKPKKGDNGMAVKTFIERKGQFSFESKDIYDEGLFHGTANYQLTNPNGSNLKFRAYETKKTHESVEGDLTVSARYGDSNNPAKDFISQLETPDRVARQVSFTKSAILKLNDFKNRKESWDNRGLLPGDSFYKPGLLREFSLSQMTFDDLETYLAWNKAMTRAKNNNGQSFESYFMTLDGHLDYKTMIEVVDGLIAEGCKKPFEVLNPHRNVARKGSLTHPQWATYQALKERLNSPD